MAIWGALADQPIQPNGGCYRPVTVRTRAGSIFDPGPDRPADPGEIAAVVKERVHESPRPVARRLVEEVLLKPIRAGL